MSRKTISATLDEFFHELRLASGGDILETRRCSQQAFSKARSGISHSIFQECFERMLDCLCSSGENQMENIVEGSNLDDNGDYRPGLLAVAELGIKSTLRECHLTKADIRALSKYLELPTWEKQSFACLSSRFVYGETITEEKLGMVDKAEQLLLDMGFHQVRVRIHGRMARIEIESREFGKLMADETRNRIIGEFRAYGFTYITMDLMDYRIGSMNETLSF